MEMLEGLCEAVFFVPNLKSSKDKENRLRSLSDLITALEDEKEELNKNPDQWRFTEKIFLEEFLDENNFQNEQMNQSDIQATKKANIIIKDFMSGIDDIAEDIFGEKCLQLLDLKSQRRKKELYIRNMSENLVSGSDKLNILFQEKEKLE